jgi:hypothetical protein
MVYVFFVKKFMLSDMVRSHGIPAMITIMLMLYLILEHANKGELLCSGKCYTRFKISYMIHSFAG